MPVKKKTAHWIRHTHIFRKDVYECSSCGFCAKKPLRSCPNCGLPMKGFKYDPSWVDEIEAIEAMLDD